MKNAGLFLVLLEANGKSLLTSILDKHGDTAEALFDARSEKILLTLEEGI